MGSKRLTPTTVGKWPQNVWCFVVVVNDVRFLRNLVIIFL